MKNKNGKVRRFKSKNLESAVYMDENLFFDCFLDINFYEAFNSKNYRDSKVNKRYTSFNERTALGKKK